MECLRGGNVFDRIVEMKKYPELDVRILIHRLLEATALFHSHNVAHRDLKPLNSEIEMIPPVSWFAALAFPVEFAPCNL
jgi:serine/threonine protein kinase